MIASGDGLLSQLLLENPDFCKLGEPCKLEELWDLSEADDEERPRQEVREEEYEEGEEEECVLEMREAMVGNWHLVMCDKCELCRVVIL